jgi:hypothetical protein
VNRSALANIGQDAWTYTALEIRAVAASGTPVSPIPSYRGTVIQSGTNAVLYNWARHNVDLEGMVNAQYQFSTIGSFSEGSGADAWVFRLPVPARRLILDDRDEYPLGTAMAYRSFVEPYMNVNCTPVLADPAWPQIRRTEADSWFQIAVPYCLAQGTGTITGTAGTGETVTVSHTLGYTPKAYDIQIVGTDTGPFASAAAGMFYVTNIDTDSFDVGCFNVNSGGSLPFSYKIMAEPPTSNIWLGPRKPYYWASSTLFNLFVQLRYEAA